MGVPFSVDCDSCGAHLTVKNVELIGKRVKCPKCRSPILISAPADPHPASHPMAPVDWPVQTTAPELPPSVDVNVTSETSPGAVPGVPVAEAASPRVVIREQKGSSSVVARRKPKSSKLPIYIGAGVVVFVLGITGIGLLMTGDDEPAPAKREQADATPLVAPQPPVVESDLPDMGSAPAVAPSDASEPVESALGSVTIVNTPDPEKLASTTTRQMPAKGTTVAAVLPTESTAPSASVSASGLDATPAPKPMVSDPAPSTVAAAATKNKAESEPAKTPLANRVPIEDATIEDLGLVVRGTSLVLSTTAEQERELSKRLSDILRQRRSLYKSTQELTAVQQNSRLASEAITRLKQQNGQLNARLAGVTDVVTNNKLVGAIQANAAQIDLTTEAKSKIDEQVRSARAEVNKLRAAYVQEILDMRELSDGVSDGYKKLSEDPRSRVAIARLTEETGKTYMVARSFKTSLKKLQSFEDAVLSEAIPLRRTPGGTLYVSVVIDGKHTHEMVLDSGASIISMPQALARECGIQVKSSDPTIVLELADGSQIEGKMVRLASVRLGKFEVKDVECAVLGAEAIRAEPLLGMSFLEHFKFEIDAQEGSLAMVQVDTSE